MKKWFFLLGGQKGRRDRKDFWIITAALCIGLFLIEALYNAFAANMGVVILVLLTGLFLSISLISNTVRRLHDLGYSGWWFFALLVGDIILALLLAPYYVVPLMQWGVGLFPGTQGPNKYGDAPVKVF